MLHCDHDTNTSEALRQSLQTSCFIHDIYIEPKTREVTPEKAPPTLNDNTPSPSPTPSRSKSKRILKKRKTSADVSSIYAVPSREAPPPPQQRRRTHHEFVRELAAEMVGRKTRAEEAGSEGRSTILDQNEIEVASGQWRNGTSGKDLYPHNGKEDDERSTFGGETVDVIPGPSRSPFGSKRVLKPRTTKAPLIPTHNATPPTPDGETTPTSSLKHAVSVERHKKQGPPPPPCREKKRSSLKQRNRVGFHGTDLDLATWTADTDGGEDGVRGITQVKLDMAGVGENITSALMDQAGSRLGRYDFILQGFLVWRRGGGGGEGCLVCSTFPPNFCICRLVPIM